MPVDLLQVSLDYAAAALPKKIMAPAARASRQYFRPAPSSNSDMSQDAFLERITNIEKKPGLSEGDMVQLFETARDFFDSLGGRKDMDVESIETAARQISYVTGVLSMAAYGAAQRYKTDLNGLQEGKIRLIKEKDLIFSRLESDKRKYQEYLDKSKALEQGLKQLEQDMDGYMQDIVRARKDLEGIRAKREEVRKWCWVPFYNIYLYVDSEKAAACFNACQERLNTAERSRAALLQERQTLCGDMLQIKHMEAEIKVRLTSNEQAMQKCIEEINQTKSKVLQYSDFTLFFGKVNARLKNQDAEQAFLTGVLTEIKIMFKQVSSSG